MLYGTVVQFFPERGFGFIRADTGADVYFHVTAIGACQHAPQIALGQPVKFELMDIPAPLRRHDDDDEGEAKRPLAPARPRAKLVELIDKMPGGVLEGPAVKRAPPPHPKARRKKPTWRR